MFCVVCGSRVYWLRSMVPQKINSVEDYDHALLVVRSLYAEGCTLILAWFGHWLGRFRIAVFVIVQQRSTQLNVAARQR